MYVCKSALHVCFLFVDLSMSVHYSPYIHACLAGPHEVNGPDSHKISAMEVIGLYLILYLHICMIYLLSYLYILHVHAYIHTYIYLLTNITYLPI